MICELVLRITSGMKNVSLVDKCINYFIDYMNWHPKLFEFNLWGAITISVASTN